MARVRRFFDFSENVITMTERIEQRYCIKFCQKLGHTQVETIRKIQQAFGNEALSPTQIKQGLNALKMAVHQMRVISARKDHPQAERRR